MSRLLAVAQKASDRITQEKIAQKLIEQTDIQAMTRQEKIAAVYHYFVKMCGEKAWELTRSCLDALTDEELEQRVHSWRAWWMRRYRYSSGDMTMAERWSEQQHAYKVR